MALASRLRIATENIGDCRPFGMETAFFGAPTSMFGLLVRVSGLAVGLAKAGHPGTG